MSKYEVSFHEIKLSNFHLTFYLSFCTLEFGTVQPRMVRICSGYNIRWLVTGYTHSETVSLQSNKRDNCFTKQINYWMMFILNGFLTELRQYCC